MAEGELDFSAVMNRLMNDKGVAELIEKMKSGSDAEEKTEEAEQKMVVPERRAAGEGDETPSDVMEKLPEVMAAIAPLMKNGTLGGIKGNKSTEKRNRLLSALKPYMNESRCSMIDSIMALSKLTGIMDAFQNK